MSVFVFVVLNCVGKGLEIDPSPDEGLLPKCLKRFVISEINSESEQPRGLDP
jgi:hypothetical protein